MRWHLLLRRGSVQGVSTAEPAWTPQNPAPRGLAFATNPERFLLATRQVLWLGRTTHPVSGPYLLRILAALFGAAQLSQQRIPYICRFAPQICCSVPEIRCWAENLLQSGALSLVRGRLTGSQAADGFPGGATRNQARWKSQSAAAEHRGRRSLRAHRPRRLASTELTARASCGGAAGLHTPQR